MRERRVHFDPGHGIGSPVLCKEPRWIAADSAKDNVTCRICLYLLGRYMPTDPERREELIKRQDKLPR